VTGRGPHGRRQRRQLIGLALLFFGPLALAFYLYYGHGAWHPGGRVNAGELIEPPRPMPSLALPLMSSGETQAAFLKHKWTLLYVKRGPCTQSCRNSLYDTRQVRLALNRDMDRVQRVFIADSDCCDAGFLQTEHPDLIVIRASAAAAPLLALLPSPPTDSERTGSGGAAAGGAHSGVSDPGGASAADAPPTYLIDPLGNLMMFYAAAARPKGMLEDLKRLLRLSSIG